MVAELAPPIPERLLQDVPGFAESISSSLAADVSAAIEGLVITGNQANPAPKDDFNGIMATSGVLTQAFATDPLTTIRKPITALQVKGVAGPFVVVLAPGDYEGMELTKAADHYVLSDPGTGGRSLPVDSSRQTLWGYPVALSVRMPTGNAIVGRFQADAIRLRPRETARLVWFPSLVRDAGGVIQGSGHEYNTTQPRLESRVGLELRKPWSFVVADLTA